MTDDEDDSTNDMLLAVIRARDVMLRSVADVVGCQLAKPRWFERSKRKQWRADLVLKIEAQQAASIRFGERLDALLGVAQHFVSSSLDAARSRTNRKRALLAAQQRALESEVAQLNAGTYQPFTETD